MVSVADVTGAEVVGSDNSPQNRDFNEPGASIAIEPPGVGIVASPPSASVVRVGVGDAITSESTESLDESLQVAPLAGFVLKTRRSSTNQKVFVNILHHGIVGSLLSTPVKTHTDKKGEVCSVYDIIMPEAHYQDCVTDEIIRDQVCVHRCLSLFVFSYLFKVDLFIFRSRV